MNHLERARRFSGLPAKECEHKHKLQGTGAIFYQSVGLLQCAHCYGWQTINKPLK